MPFPRPPFWRYFFGWLAGWLFAIALVMALGAGLYVIGHPAPALPSVEVVYPHSYPEIAP